MIITDAVEITNDFTFLYSKKSLQKSQLVVHAHQGIRKAKLLWEKWIISYFIALIRFDVLKLKITFSLLLEPF